MIQHTSSTIGQFHINHNEDFLVTENINDDRLLIAVMDGCSMGKESHFASTLMGKLLRKIAKEISFKEFINNENKSPNEHLEEILMFLFKYLKELKNNLMLETEEILSTLIIGIFDKKHQQVELLTIGDGLICINENYYEYEQGDRPDYLGYHLNKEFEDWYNSQQQRLSFKGVNDLSISTDGIFTFKKFDDKEQESINDEALVNYLLIDQQWKDQATMLKKKLIEIENRFGLRTSDDLSIVRIIKEQNRKKRRWAIANLRQS